ncbi:MotE family protein [Halarcobacter anaerophilus]|jgi:flagellar motility protein MotE (MotC chaperone)|uniref:PDP protein n=1 Tax=Halarcobacter anaerophilus TaxID=877500 RepID=A0A4Q0Y1Z9_9BACT|nr:hypothetical protein [Halarcobacter anaerophilus]QDF30120.1 hypothetical protein AANAER_2674 [Halarcobacter anaerophilus]RXJ63164.1 hypothetical protein CRV06_07845 [Halarcobacter anaerophilus]
MRLLIILLFVIFNLEAQEVSSATLIKQKIEIKELKKDLNNFYNKKEKEYQTRKKELETLLSKIEKEKNEIQSLRDENRELLSNIKGEVENKTAKIYNKMKPKIAANIFNQMISEGKIEDVFDIILRLKDSKVTSLMKYISPMNASMLTQMLQDYKENNNNEG